MQRSHSYQILNPGAGAWVQNLIPGAGAWVQILYAGAGSLIISAYIAVLILNPGAGAWVQKSGSFCTECPPSVYSFRSESFRLTSSTIFGLMHHPLLS